MRYLIIFLSIFSFVLPVHAGPQPDMVDVSVLNWNGTPAVGVQFPIGEATVENPWVHSPQYLRVIYSSGEDLWGIRIITKNEENIGQVYPKLLNKGPDNKWEWENHPDWGGKYKYENGQWLTGDDSVSFGGLIDPASKNNPNYRADFAWQVFSQPVVEPDTIYYNPWGSWYGYWNVGSNPILHNGIWKYPYEWAYVVDKSNKWNGESVLGGIFYPPPPLYSLKYEIVANGSGQLGWLAQYPPNQMTNPDPRYGDGWDANGDGVINELDDNDINNDGYVECDMAIYMAACFAIKENGQFVSLLPAGNYSTVSYVELIANE